MAKMHNERVNDVDEASLHSTSSFKFRKRLEALTNYERVTKPFDIEDSAGLSDALHWRIILIKDNADFEAEFYQRSRMTSNIVHRWNKERDATENQSRSLSRVSGGKLSESGGNKIPLVDVDNLDGDSKIPRRFGGVAHAG